MRVGLGHGQGRAVDRIGITCQPHDAWGNNFNLVGRTLDLEAAYKRLAMKRRTAWVRPIVIWSPVRRQPVFYLAQSLMFGATGSMCAFNTAALSIWHLLVKLGKLWVDLLLSRLPKHRACLQPPPPRGCASLKDC